MRIIWWGLKESYFSVLWNINLCFSIKQVNVYWSINCHAICCWIENVANHLSVREWMIRNRFWNSARHLVCNRYQEFSSWKCVELWINVPFNLRLVPYLESLSGLDDFLQVLIHFRIGIEVFPQNFSVLRIISSSKVLFGSVINDGDTDWSEGHDVTGFVVFDFVSPISTPTQGTSIVVIIDEVGHVIEAFKVDILGPLIVIISDVVHVFVVEDGVSDPKEEWVIENTADWSDVRSKVPHWAIEDFSDGINSWSLGELGPEPFWHFGDGIDSQTINVVFLNQVSDPTQQSGSDVIVFLF